MEPGETVEEAARREVHEETGIAIAPAFFQKVAYTDDFFEVEKLRYITLYLETHPRHPAENLSPVICEPDKCQEWTWARHSPGSLFLPVRNLLREWPGVVWRTH